MKKKGSKRLSLKRVTITQITLQKIKGGLPTTADTCFCQNQSDCWGPC